MTVGALFAHTYRREAVRQTARASRNPRNFSSSTSQQNKVQAKANPAPAATQVPKATEKAPRDIFAVDVSFFGGFGPAV